MREIIVRIDRAGSASCRQPLQVDATTRRDQGLGRVLTRRSDHLGNVGRQRGGDREPLGTLFHAFHNARADHLQDSHKRTYPVTVSAKLAMVI